MRLSGIPGTKKPLPKKWFIQQGYKDSNLEMTESESVALPFGDSPVFAFRLRQVVLYNTLRENASPFFHFFLFSGRKIVKYPGYL